ncbi:hypothetical protein B7P43_G00729, partial [Cryptotermes secundus]
STYFLPPLFRHISFYPSMAYRSTAKQRSHGDRFLVKSPLLGNTYNITRQ